MQKATGQASQRNLEAFLFVLFFVSGALGLGYQVLWSKVLLGFIGVSAYSYAVVLAAFMAGLALGAEALGRVVDRSRSPLRIYAWLELFVGLYAVVFEPLAAAAEGLYGAWVGPAASGATGGIGLKAALAALLLMPPALLMGGTFPALVRQVTASPLGLMGHVSRLYGANALGAVAGTLAMAFLLMPLLGMRGSLMLLAIGNLAVAMAAFLRARTAAPAVAVTAAGLPVPGPAPAPRTRLALVLAVAAGFLSFGLEVAWTRYFAVVLGSSTYSFAVMLAAFISGIGLGALILARIGERVDRPLVLFGWSELLAGAFLLLTLPLYPYLPRLLDLLTAMLSTVPSAFYLQEAGKLALCYVIMLPATVFLGLSIPLVIQGVAGASSRTGALSGRVYAVNTAGNVIGALSAGLVLLPLLGMETLLAGLAVGATLLGAMAVALLGPPAARPYRRLWPATLAAALAALAVFGPRWDRRWFTLVPGRREPLLPAEDLRRRFASQSVRYFADDPAAHLLVIQGTSGDGQHHFALLINGKPDASTETDMPTQVLIAHLPLLLHPDPRQALIVGLGSGVTAGAALRHEIERLDVVEVVGRMPEAAAFFHDWNGDPLADRRTRYIADDARTYLMHTASRYDVIVSEPSNPWVAGVGSLFAREFYEKARSALLPGGLYLQWVQAYDLSNPTFSVLLRTFRQVFPEVYVFQGANLDLMLIGALDPLAPDWPLVEQRLGRPAVTEQLATVGIRGLQALLFLQRFSPATADWIASLAPIENTDDNLYLEYRAPRDLFESRTPDLIDWLDERRLGSPGLFLGRYLRERPAALDLEALTALVGSSSMVREPLATVAAQALSRLQLERGVEVPSRAALDRLVPRWPEVRTSALLEAFSAAVRAGQPEQVRFFAAVYGLSIRLEAWLAPETAGRWSDAVGEAIAAGRDSAISEPLVALQVDLLATAGRTAEGRRALAGLFGTDMSLPDDQTVLRGCRLDPGALCDQLIAARRGSPARAGREQLERLAELRAGRRRDSGNPGTIDARKLHDP